MRHALPVLSLVAAALCAAAPTRADHAPAIVVPGKPGMPVIINGVDATGAVVHGDWGLYRPGHGQIVVEGPVVYVGPWSVGGYYPYSGRAPAYGRHEIEPKRRIRSSTDFYRTWSIESDTRQPVTQYPPFNPPEVIVGPRERTETLKNPPGERRR